MPRTFLRQGEVSDPIGGTASITFLFGTNEAETISLNANAYVVLDGSFSRGNDTINILGNAALYTAKLSGSNVVLTSGAGASITIPFGSVGTTVSFADSTATKLVVNPATGSVTLGNQAITATGVALTNGSSTGGTGGTGGGTGGGGTDGSGFTADSSFTIVFNVLSTIPVLILNDGSMLPATDNANQVFAFGSGNNLLKVTFDQSNAAATGSVTREDYTFLANMGAGNDVVQLKNGDGFAAMKTGGPTSSMTEAAYATGTGGLQVAEDWFLNHVIVRNVAVRGGEGNDRVETWGASAALIDLGAGNDVAITDNSGETTDFNKGHATWVFNTRPGGSGETDVRGLASQVPATLDNVANLTLTVRFLGRSSTVVVGNSAGSMTGVSISDLSINQAIKAAIAADPVLKALIVAEDGPARTLIVRSLIDGEMAVGDLAVSLGTSGPLVIQQQAGTALALFDTTGNLLDPAVLGFNAAGQATGTRFDSQFGFDFTRQLTGYDSININVNQVTGGAGNDLIVLSSNGIGNGIGVNSTTMGNSTETVVLADVFDDDVIVNFTAADDGIASGTPGKPGGLSATSFGYDIFDVSLLVGGAVTLVENTAQLDGAEFGTAATLVARQIALIDTIENDDSAFSASTLTEAQRLQEIVRSTDITTGTASQFDAIVITVDGSRNLGTFYLVQNGGGAGDATVTRLGSIELLDTALASKGAIGAWDAMSLTNFTPLDTAGLIQTFAFA
jgi:hypothetical protein